MLEIYFFETHVENEAGRLFPDFFEKALYKVKAKDQHLSTWVHSKIKLYHISGR